MRKYAIIFLAFVLLLAISGCSNEQVTPLVSMKAPTGKNCGENIVYLQEGVNVYKEMTGSFPTELDVLAEPLDGKGPVLEFIPKCPSGNLYLIQDGLVIEKH
ncbi:hypothetical protein BHU72_08535 [Desulfuribacillus stibiiarsenatis]|uniref:Lipoprotein n=1 Tax=Desulfuribacillus stibiiarsenatis TaxID=1390249 RepID=A0A1E5L387_9FIRM|nr:hypothetical protein [Desulfuribacillus stibiiarsenatis]OEH84546.1 hypothetical protein BHU72_08535 [Desulfuribacillus stibiiarsenatis]